MLGSFVGIADYASFVIAIVVFLLIPGPGNLALITSTSKGGIAGGMGATFGVIAGDQVLLWAAVAGVSAVMVAYPSAFHAVQHCWEFNSSIRGHGQVASYARNFGGVQWSTRSRHFNPSRTTCFRVSGGSSPCWHASVRRCGRILSEGSD